MKYFVSSGNSFGRYSDHLPNTFKTHAEAEAWGEDQYPEEGYTVWYIEDGEEIVV